MKINSSVILKKVQIYLESFLRFLEAVFLYSLLTALFIYFKKYNNFGWNGFEVNFIDFFRQVISIFIIFYIWVESYFLVKKLNVNNFHGNIILVIHALFFTILALLIQTFSFIEKLF